VVPGGAGGGVGGRDLDGHRVRDEDADRAEALPDRRHGRGPVGLGGGVRADRESTAAVGLDLGGDGVGGLDVGEHDGRAFCREAARASRANPRRSARDQGILALKPLTHEPTPNN
jgi:hypothetical protein